MAQDLLDRIVASLRPNGRIADCHRVLADCEKEFADIEARIALAERDSTNPKATEEDAREAWQRAEDLRLRKRRLGRGIGELRRAIEQKEEARRSEERASAYAAAKAERDELIKRWLEYGAAYAAHIQLLADTHANDELLARTNRMLPEGSARLRSAELEARGAMNEERWPSGDQFTRLTSLEWGRFDRPGLAFSVRETERRAIAAQINRDGARAAAAAAAREAANTPEALAAKAKAEAVRYSFFRVEQKRYSGAGRIRVVHRDGTAGIGDEAANLWLDVDQVRAAEKLGLKVERAQFHEAAVLGTLSRPRGVLQLSNQS